MRGDNDIDATADDDRISQLPEPILHYILSFLGAKDAARISTLSKVWASAWNSLPYLNFDYLFYWSKNRSMNVFIDKTLANRKKHKISLQKFSLLISGNHPCLSYVDNWINILIDCNIKELNLVSQLCNLKYDRLPQAIFAAKDLNVLSLSGFKIELPPDHGTIKFSSLRELQLSDVFMDDQFFQALCTNCCNLEHLSLRNLYGLASFQIGETCLPKLKKVNLELSCCGPSVLQLVDIATINLEDLTIYSHQRYGNINVVRITACKSLKSLYLNGVDVTENWLDELFYSLQNLEMFRLIYCKTLETMKITSDSLKILRVYSCNNLIAVELDTPNLIKFFCFNEKLIVVWIEGREKKAKGANFIWKNRVPLAQEQLR